MGLSEAGADPADPAGEEGEQVRSAGHAGLDVDSSGLARAEEKGQAQEESQQGLHHGGTCLVCERDRDRQRLYILFSVISLK